MGRGYSGFINTQGAKNRLVPDDLMIELENSGAKFNKDEVLMITKNYVNKLMWLEEGNERAGLKHIQLRHSVDFAPGVNIPLMLKDLLKRKPIEHSVRKGRNGKKLADVYIYKKDHHKYKVAYGSNGYIVSFYLISDKKGAW